MLSPDSNAVKRIDAALREWRQGDLALGESWFVHVANGAEPLTALTALAAEAEGADGPSALTSEVPGLVVVTQTCDIVMRSFVKSMAWWSRSGT